MNKYKEPFFVLAAVCCLALVSCGTKKNDDEHEHEHLAVDIVELTDAQIQTCGVQLGRLETRSMSSNLKVNGEISSLPQNLATVSMSMGGRVGSVSLIPGTQVHKGQTLAVIEAAEFIDLQQNYLETKNKLEFVAADYERQKSLFNNDATSRKNMQQVTSEYRALKIQRHAFEQKLILIGLNPHTLNVNNLSRKVAVKSPIDGYIKTVNINVGKIVSPSDVLFDIIDLHHLYVKLTVFEKDIDKIAKGQKLKFYINDEAEAHEAVILQTSKSLDTDKTYKVYASILSKCYNILPGMFVNAFVSLQPANVTAVPEDAVVSFEGNDYLFVFNKNKKEKGKSVTEYKMIQIKKGYSEDGYIQVIIPAGTATDKIVVKGAYSLLSAMKNAGEMSC